MPARKIRLSPKKQKWADRFKPESLRGARLAVPVAVQVRYDAALQKLVREMVAETEREVRALFQSPTAVASHVATDASISSQSRILMNALHERFSLLFARAARGLSERMVDDVQRNSATGLKRSLRDIAGNISIKTDVLKSGPVAEMVKASIAENVALIKTLPEAYLGKVSTAVMRSITSGNGLQDLVPFFTKQKGITERHARNMAYDQTRKATNGINRGRMQGVGIKRFEWVHTGGGQAPRQDHIDMSGNVYSFDDLPVIDARTGERGIPGQAPNCRCIMRPVLDFGAEA
jgi:SPP1 gp7 family putative phage head morphogenesis protein